MINADDTDKRETDGENLPKSPKLESKTFETQRNGGRAMENAKIAHSVGNLHLVPHTLWSASAFGGLFHQQDERQAGGEHHGQQTEGTNVRKQGGRALHDATASGGVL